MGSSSDADDPFGDPWATPSSRTSDPFSTTDAWSEQHDAFGGDPFGSPTQQRSRSVLTAVRPPLGWLWAAVATAIAALVISIVFLERSVPLAFTAWALGGVVTIGLTAAFQIIDTRRRTSTGYGHTTPGLSTLLYVAALAIGLTAVVVSAITLALWAGRGF